MLATVIKPILLTLFNAHDYDYHFEQLEQIIGILKTRFDEPWLDLLHTRMLIKQNKLDIALRFINRVKNDHEIGSDLYLQEAEILASENKHAEAVSVLDQMLMKKRIKDIVIYQKAIDIPLDTQEGENILRYLQPVCELGVNSNLRRKSDYLKFQELSIDEWHDSKNIQINELNDFEKILGYLECLFDEKIETSVIVEIFKAGLSLIRKRTNEAVKHANSAFDTLNDNDIHLCLNSLKILKKVFVAGECKEQMQALDNYSMGANKNDNEIVLKINQHYISDKSVQLSSIAKESIIIVMYNKQKKVAAMLCLLRPGSVSLRKSVKYFNNIISQMINELLSYKIEKNDIELSVYAGDLYNHKGVNDTKVSSLDQLLKVFSQLNVIPSSTNISKHTHISISIGVMNGIVTVNEVIDTNSVALIDSNEALISADVDFIVDQIDENEEENDSASNVDSG